MFNNEVWKDIEGYEGLYQVSNLGRVRSFKNGKVKFLKPSNKDGYLKVHFRKDNYSYTPLIHRLVAQAFIPNPDNLPMVNHKDEDKTNNRVENLEWCDSKYNNNYGNRNKKIAETLSKVVLQIDKNTNIIINIFPSLMEAERQTGCKNNNICNCCKGKYKTAYGYKWKYQQKERD